MPERASSSIAGAGESIRFAVASRSDGEALRRKLAPFDATLVHDGEQWLVEIAPDARLTPFLLQLFTLASEWLVERELPSIEVRFGKAPYTLVHPTDAHPYHSAEFLLQRVIQLQEALDSRVTIEQAKGIIAGRFRMAVDDAFAVLRRAARGAGRHLHDLADEVVRADDLPEDVRRVLNERRRRS